jgi:DNA polymerase-3 subunit beta
MKLIVSKAAIEGAANMLSKVINAKNALPILGDIMCEVKDQEMRMTASDSEVTMSTTITLETAEGEGRFCVSAEKLKDALSQLAEQPVTILATTESDMMFRLQHSTGETFFPLENADEYPLPMAEKYNETLDDVQGQWIIDALKRTLWATANDDLRPVMNGVYFGLDEGYLDIVASDGHVLVKSRYSVIDKVKVNRCGSFIMPKKVAKILSEVTTTNAKLEWNERWAHVGVGLCDITFRLIEGKYPNYNSIIPDNQPLMAVVPRALMVSAIRKVLPFTNTSSMMLCMNFETNLLTLSGDDYDFSQGATDKITVEYAGEPIAIGAKGSGLLTLFAKLSGQEVDVHMTDPSRAIVITPSEQPEDCEILMLTMPMLIND